MRHANSANAQKVHREVHHPATHITQDIYLASFAHAFAYMANVTFATKVMCGKIEHGVLHSCPNFVL